MRFSIVDLAVAIAILIAQVNVCSAQDASSRAKQAYGRAIELESKGNHPAALALLWQAADLAPSDPEIQNALGEALERIGALDAAIAAYRAALQPDPQFRRASNNLILALVKAGKGEEAVQRARDRVAQAPNDPDRYFTLGLAQSEQNVEEAMKSFRRALEIDPRHALARYNLALALDRSDRVAEAIEEMKQTLAIDPRAETHYRLGVMYSRQGEFDAAIRELKAAIDRDPRSADAHAALGAVFRARRDWENAERELRRAIAINPDPARHYTLAQVLQQRGDSAGATAALAEAERLRHRREQDQQASVLTSVGTAKFDDGDLAGALELFRRAVAASDQYAPAYYQMGRTLQRLGRNDEARDAFKRAASLNPSLAVPKL
ncbi:MAG TPA: tetratricopeptide repeat protein [Vicinamibacterales bacterium]|nr:tetratricopeptide repeat protein [Vicinamibacterales bacterium]